MKHYCLRDSINLYKNMPGIQLDAEDTDLVARVVTNPEVLLAGFNTENYPGYANAVDTLFQDLLELNEDQIEMLELGYAKILSY